MGGFGGFLSGAAQGFTKGADQNKKKGGGKPKPGGSPSDSGGGPEPELPSFSKGGMVKKTGPIKAHRGERVLNKRQTKAYNKKHGRGK